MIHDQNISFSEEPDLLSSVREIPVSKREAIRSFGREKIRIPPEVGDYWEADMIRVVCSGYLAAKIASFKRKAPFHLSADHLGSLMRRSVGRCELTGIKFSGDNFSSSRRRPFVPSIDRINSKEPYALDNCRLVAWIVNLAISDWGEDIFWVMVKAAGKKGRYDADEQAPPTVKRRRLTSNW